MANSELRMRALCGDRHLLPGASGRPSTRETQRARLHLTDDSLTNDHFSHSIIYHFLSFFSVRNFLPLMATEDYRKYFVAFLGNNGIIFYR